MNPSSVRAEKTGVAASAREAVFAENPHAHRRSMNAGTIHAPRSPGVTCSRDAVTAVYHTLSLTLLASRELPMTQVRHGGAVPADVESRIDDPYVNAARPDECQAGQRQCTGTDRRLRVALVRV
jgi:hypothetical protein